jgi:peptidoglycan/LPS O-acetylase OafA/YrhL
MNTLSDRNGSVDLLRFLGAIGIVLFHVKAPGSAIGYAALPAFVAITILYTLQGSAGQTASGFLGSRARRLLIPWLGWSAIYGAAKLADAAMRGAPVGSEFRPWMVLTGPAIHLWFLPFAFLATALVVGGSRLFRLEDGGRTPGGRLLGGCLVFVAFAALALVLRHGFDLRVPFAQWVFVLPAVGLGVCLQTVEHRLPDLAIVVVLAAAIHLAAVALGLRAGTFELLLATTACTLTLAVRLPPAALLRRLGGLSLGIYLVHPLIVAILLRAGGKALGGAPLFPVLVILASCGAVLLLRQTPLRAIV